MKQQRHFFVFFYTKKINHDVIKERRISSLKQKGKSTGAVERLIFPWF